MPGQRDDLIRLSVVGPLLRRRWRVLVAAMVLGAMFGGVVTLMHPPSYSSSSQVLIGDKPDETRVVSEARIAMSAAVLDRVGGSLQRGLDGVDLARTVSARATDGNIVEITARASSPARARQLAELTTEQYLVYSIGLLTKIASASVAVLLPQRESLQKRVDEIEGRLAQLRAQPEMANSESIVGASARGELQDLARTHTRVLQEVANLEGRIAQAESASASGAQYFAVIDRPVEPAAPSSASRAKVVGGSALATLALAALALVLSRLRDRRLYGASDIARAVGAPVLGVVPAPEGEKAAGPGSRAEWNADREYEELCYRRVVSRLTESPEIGPAVSPVPVVVVLVAGDRFAERAAALVAGPQLRPASLQVLPVPRSRPALPDLPPAARVLLVISAGTLTVGHLMTIAGACHDAGCPPYGVLLVAPDGQDRSIVEPVYPGIVPAAALGPS